MAKFPKMKEVLVPTSVTFELYSAEEIRRMSVVQVITPLSMSATGQGLPGGLYDPLMGPHNKSSTCATCQKSLDHCSGHFGHIELPLPVINPLFSKTVLQIFRLSCLNCNSVVVPGVLKYLTIAQLKLLDHGLVNEAQEAEHIYVELCGDSDNKKFRKKNMAASNAEDELARTKFDEYLMKALKGQPKKQDISSTGQALKNLVTRNILRLALMSNKCHLCGTVCKRMTMTESRILYTMVGGRVASSRNGDPTGESTQKYLTPMEAKKHLQAVWLKDQEFLDYMFPVLQSAATDFPTDLFFIDVLAVPPPKNRPAQVVNSVPMEHPLNLTLRSVVQSCAIIQYIVRALKEGLESLSTESQQALKVLHGQSLQDKLEVSWNQLQADVDHVMDRDRNNAVPSARVTEMMGLKQMIERKEGLFRMHMMGKRVNYAARTVITPDPNIAIDEIGIPDAFAKVLTYPCTVTPANIYHLRQLIINGPAQYPGATAVLDENGKLTRLSSVLAHREAVANRLLVSDSLKESSFTGVKTVYRHLQNGDLLLMNRQPSLHRPSIMAHRARVLHGEKVFRLHYANCKHYNADFDGDEMNAHFPQDEESRAEAATLVNACNHFLVPKDGTPLGGLIQDHVVGAVKMTVRGRFFQQEDYHQLVFFALSGQPQRIELEPPTILKPVLLWSGKQVITTIIKNLIPKTSVPITLTSSAKIKSKEWEQWESRPFTAGGAIVGDDLSESVVIFRHGQLLTGVLDKVHLGATPFGLCHAFYELYGSMAVGSLLSSFSKLCTNFLQWEGFTLGIKDILVMPGANDERQEYMKKAAAVGPAAAAKAVGLPPSTTDLETIESKIEAVHRARDPKATAMVDQAYKQVLDKFNNKINSSCLPYGLVSIFPHNNLQLLVQSGAKGSTVNTMQISCLLGQIELEGKRPPLTLSGKSLPSFKPYDLSPRAGGFILGRFLTGIRPQEFFFHCMAGREGLIDTAVKTSRSGYLQRCIVKLLEGVVAQYDMTVRDSDGSVIQFLYGEDGLDVGKAQYLNPKQMKFLQENRPPKQQSWKTRAAENETLEQIKEKITAWQEDGNKCGVRKRTSDFLSFSKRKSKEFRHLNDLNDKTGRSLASEALQAKWRAMSDSSKESFRKRNAKCPEPVLGTYFPSTWGVLSEKLEKTLQSVKGDDGAEFKNVVYAKAQQAMVNPGDAVGVLAAQSIGEPSTQMTLNTFHFAGRGEMNVTLGIPRLREILMVASENIKTPCMDVPFLPHVSPERAEALRIRLTRVSMDQVLQSVTVTEKLQVSGSRLYQLRFKFLSFSEYQDMFAATPSSILRYFEISFIRANLLPAIRRALNLAKRAFSLETETRLARDHNNDSGGKDSGDEENNNGNDSNKRQDKYSEAEKKGQGEEHESSDEEEAAEDADATQAKRSAQHFEREYEDPEEEERMEEDEEVDVLEGEENPAADPLSGDEDKEEEEDDGAESGDSVKSFRVSRENASVRRSNVIALDTLVYNYDLDRKEQKWCELTLSVPGGNEKLNMGLLLKELAPKGVIHHVPEINRAFVMKNNESLSLRTDGINILAMTSYQDLLDLNKIHCNSIHVMARHFGIEAALKVLIKELTDVFKAYGIVIDPRHMSLIADYMTNSGSYRPFNRIGIGSSTSPLHQMSFETVVAFLREATLSGKKDQLQNPSSRLILGKSVNVGTELFDCHATSTGLPALDVGRKFRNVVSNPPKKLNKSPGGNKSSSSENDIIYGAKLLTKRSGNNENIFDPFAYFVEKA